MDQNIETVVKQLKTKGYRLSTIHWRNVKTPYSVTTPTGKFEVEVPVSIPLFEARRKGIMGQLMARGGYTTMRLVNREKKIEVLGESRCHPNDSFNNKLAFVKAFSNLMANAKKAGINLE